MRLLEISCFAAIAFLSASCADELPATDGVQHLELALADGSSSTSLLAGAEVIWCEQLEIAGPQTDLGSWSTQYCRIEPVPGNGPGIALRGIVPEVQRMKRVELRSSKTYAASDIDFIELELARTAAGIARVSWRSSLDGMDADQFPRSATDVVPLIREPHKLRISLSTQPGWVGEISELSVAPKEEGVQRFDVVAVRMGRLGFSPGPDRLDAAAGKDGGLIALGLEALRAYPSDWNVPLFARAKVPRGGRLLVGAGVSTNTTNVTAEVHFRVDAREDPAQPWQMVGGTSIVPGMRAQGPAWEHLSIPLSEFENREIELRFAASDRGPPRDDGKLERARMFWGEPLISGDRPADARPNVLLITLDTVRADSIGAQLGNPFPSPTPFIDSLAARGIVFEQAWSACNATSPSHASLLTGLAVQDHGLVDNRSQLSPANVTLAERFRDAGWQTAAAVSVPHLTPGKSGLGQGFDRFWIATQESAADGAKTVAAVNDWLRGFAREGQRPVFLWMHLFDAHTPYEVPQVFVDIYAKRMGVKVPPRQIEPATLPANRFSAQGQFLSDVTNREWAEFMYRVCVAYEDELLRRMFTVLQQQGMLDNTFIAITADHGEALGEHDNYYHHTGLYREVVHVPLILVEPRPSASLRGVRVSEPVWSLDLARTLFGLSGEPIPPEVKGIDLFDFAAETDRKARRVFFEHSNLQQIGCVDGEHSAIYSVVDYLQLGADRKRAAGTLELFDAAADAGQLHDLERDRSEAAARYRQEFSAWRAGALNRATLRGETSPEEEQRLKQLGY